MNPQPPNTYPAAYPDARIDQVLEALRTTEPPTGLEQRIAARLAQAAEARALTANGRAVRLSFLAVILNAVKDPRTLLAQARLYSVAAAALTLLLAVTTLALHHYRTPPSAAQSKSIPNKLYAPTQPATLAQAFGLDNTRVPQGFSLGSHIPNQRAGGLTPAPSQQPPDPDAIALAETLAPSRPAPPMPLTPQEHLMLAATRPGQPIQIAELDMARAPILRAAAEAREDANIRRYVKTLLAPFAVADALSPTNFSQPQETSTPAPPPPPSNASPN